MMVTFNYNKIYNFYMLKDTINKVAEDIDCDEIFVKKYNNKEINS